MILVILASSISVAQIDSLKKIYLSGAMADPRAPGSFYDYWKEGYTISTGAYFNFYSGLDFRASLEYSSFAFSQERLFQKLKVDEHDVTMEGATTSIGTISGNIIWTLYEYAASAKRPRVYILGGAGIQFSNIATSTINYPLAPASQARKLNVVPCLQIGCGLTGSLTRTTDWIVECDYLYGLTSSQIVNTDYRTVHVGIAITP